ncbi:MAG: cohesin domain-containing protein [Rhodothermales bacterium]
MTHRSAQAQISVTLPDLQVAAGASELIPITVSDLTGQDIISYQFTISYDPTIVEFTGADVTGTLSESTSALLFVNTTVSGKLTVSLAEPLGVTGAGVLVNLQATFLQEGSSSLVFDSFNFNEEGSAATTNGLITVGTGTTGSVNVSVPSSSSGTVGGSQLSIPVSVNDVTGKNITSYSFTLVYDAATIDIASFSTAGTLSGAAAPTVNTGTSGQITVTWNDGTPLTGSGVLGNLLVNPVATGISTLTLATMQFNSGDPVANVTNGSVTISGANDPIAVSLPALSGNAGTILSVPMTVGDVTGSGVSSFNTTLDYDQTLLQVSAVNQTGTMTAATAATVDLSTPGKIGISWSGATLSGAGTLLNINFTLLGGGSSPLTFDNFSFNGGNVPATTNNGSVTVIESGQIAVSMPTNIIGEIGQQVTIPVNTGDLTGENVLSYVFTVAYDPDDITITGATVNGTLSAGNTVSVNTNTPGQVIVSLTSGTPLSGAGVLVNMSGTLVGPGTSPLSFSSFQYNAGSPAVSTVDGSVTVQGFATYLQIVHNSSDAPAVDIYLNDVKYIDGLSYGSATAFLELTNEAVKLDVVRNDANDNTNPVTSTNVSLESDKDYVAVINGLYTGSGKQAIGLVLQDSQQESSNENSVGLNVFQGSPDAPPVNAYVVDDSESYNRILTLAKGLSFGDSFLAREFEPGVYNIEITQNSGERIGIYRADLSRTGGAALLFIIQGFVNPIIGQPDLSITAYAPDGRAIFLPLATDNEDEFTLPNAFGLEGNYPNPFNPSTSVEFNLPEPASVNVDVFDMLGRQVMSTDPQPFQAGSRHAIQLDASSLSSGTYVYRIVAHGNQQIYTESKTMTLLK